LDLWNESSSVVIQMKATVQYFLELLFIKQYKVIIVGYVESMNPSNSTIQKKSIEKIFYPIFELQKYHTYLSPPQFS